MNEYGHVVEQAVGTINENGIEVPGDGVAQVWVDTEDRAKQIVQQGLEAVPPRRRTYRRVLLVDMPAVSRENILRARREVEAAAQ